MSLPRIHAVSWRDLRDEPNEADQVQDPIQGVATKPTPLEQFYLSKGLPINGHVSLRNHYQDLRHMYRK